MHSVRDVIEGAFADRQSLSPENAPAEIRQAVAEALDALDDGRERVAEPVDGAWRVNEWLKMAVLLSFRIEQNRVFDLGPLRCWDKV